MKIYLIDQRDEETINAAAAIIALYTEMGSYPSTGEDFHHLATFMGSLGWFNWGGEEELEGFLATNRPGIERRVREIQAQERVREISEQIYGQEGEDAE